MRTADGAALPPSLRLFHYQVHWDATTGLINRRVAPGDVRVEGDRMVLRFSQPLRREVLDVPLRVSVSLADAADRRHVLTSGPLEVRAEAP